MPSMANSDLLQTFLHLHLATDAAAASSLPLVVSTLSSSNLDSSLHLAKWTNRVNSLIHSREPGARWAGITLALYTSRLSRNVLMSSSQGWVSTVLPMLSRNESIAVWKASIRLLAFVFTSTTDLSEFQRHVAIPNVPKLSSALLSLAEKQSDEELRVLCLDMLTTIVPLYPTLHRQMASALSGLSLNFLNGSPNFTPSAIIASAAKLHACLHTIGGKVGGAALWRKSVDETIEFCSVAVTALRTTYTTEDKFSLSQNDPLITVPLNLDRLRCGVELLCHLLRVKVERPVTVPIRSLVNLCVDMLRLTGEGPGRNDVDSPLRSMEAAAVPNILELGCSLTGCLARCIQGRLAPYLSRIFGVIVFHLEQPGSKKERLLLIELLPSLLGSCLPPHEPLICGRVIKSILPIIARLLSQKSTEESTTAGSTDTGSKKGKKRARGYEGDEVFKVGPSMLCESAGDAELVLAALGALPYLLRIPNIPAYLHSLSSRLLLSLLIALPKLPPSSVASDPTFKERILCIVKSTCIELASGSSAVLSQSLPLVLDAIMDDEVSSDNVAPGSNWSQNALLLDLMLHPRLPPLLRALPPLDTIALYQSEEGTEGRKTRESLGLRCAVDSIEVDDETTQSIGKRPEQEMQQTVQSERVPEEVYSVTGPSAEAPIVIPTVPIRPAVPVVVQPIGPDMMTTAPSYVAQSIMEPSNSQVQATAQETDRPMVQPSPKQYEEHKAVTPITEPPPRKGTAESIPQRAPQPIEPTRMVVDDDDDEEDIEMPPIDPASPSDSESSS